MDKYVVVEAWDGPSLQEALNRWAESGYELVTLTDYFRDYKLTHHLTAVMKHKDAN
jgi:hypothetical protein